jgi:hypothetical protein
MTSDGLKVIFSDWRFRVRICCNDPAIIINVETRCDHALDAAEDLRSCSSKSTQFE